MYNKKGTAFEEFVGLGAFSFAVLIGLLFLFGCRVYEKTQDYEEFEFSKEELEATKALNAFLGMPVDEERNVIDLIIESVNNGDYADLNTAAVDHFGDLTDECKVAHWRFKIFPTIRYDSVNYNEYSHCFCISGAVAEIEIPVIKDDLKLDKLKVTLFITEKCN